MFRNKLQIILLVAGVILVVLPYFHTLSSMSILGYPSSPVETSYGSPVTFTATYSFYDPMAIFNFEWYVNGDRRDSASFGPFASSPIVYSYTTSPSLPVGTYTVSCVGDDMTDDNPPMFSESITLIVTSSSPSPTPTPEVLYNLVIDYATGGYSAPMAGTYVFEPLDYVSILAIPNFGYSFWKWTYIDYSRGSAVTSTSYDSTVSFVMRGDVYLTPHFTVTGSPTPTPTPYTSPTPSPTPTATPSPTPTPVPTPPPTPPPIPPLSTTTEVTLVISATDGGVTDPAVGSYIEAKGSTVTVTALPNSSYLFQNWLFSDGTVSNNEVLTLTLTDSVSVMAVFTPKTVYASPTPTPFTYIVPEEERSPYSYYVQALGGGLVISSFLVGRKKNA